MKSFKLSLKNKAGAIMNRPPRGRGRGRGSRDKRVSADDSEDPPGTHTGDGPRRSFVDFDFEHFMFIQSLAFRMRVPAQRFVGL